MAKPIYIDSRLPAVLRYADKELAYYTVPEAIVARGYLAEADKNEATITTSGVTYNSNEIGRLHKK